jgi:hypothetical protein
MGRVFLLTVPVLLFNRWCVVCGCADSVFHDGARGVFQHSGVVCLLHDGFVRFVFGVKIPPWFCDLFVYVGLFSVGLFSVCACCFCWFLLISVCAALRYQGFTALGGVKVLGIVCCVCVLCCVCVVLCCAVCVVCVCVVCVVCVVCGVCVGVVCVVLYVCVMFVCVLFVCVVCVHC